MSAGTPTKAHTLSGAGGLPYPAAIELAAQIDGTVKAERLVAVGIPYPVAIELAKQMTAKSGNVANLHASGMNPQLAGAIKTAIAVP